MYCECKKNGCQYYFSVDSTAHLDNSDTLKLLIEQNRTILNERILRRQIIQEEKKRILKDFIAEQNKIINKLTII